MYSPFLLSTLKRRAPLSLVSRMTSSFDHLVGRVDDLALDHARRLSEPGGHPRHQDDQQPEHIRDFPHCITIASALSVVPPRARTEHTPVVLTLRGTAQAGRPAGPTRAVRWDPAFRFTPQSRRPRDPEAMLRSARFAAAFASGDDPSEDERSPPPGWRRPADSDSTPVRGFDAPSSSSRTTPWSGTSSGCCSSSKAMPCSRPRTARTR